MSSKKLFSCWILTFLVPLFVYGQWSESKNLVKAKGIISLDKVHPGGCFHLAVIVVITDRWHINAHKSSEENLIPTELKFENKSGLKFSELIYPSPILKTFIFSDQKLAVYEGSQVIGARVSLSSKHLIGKLTIRGKLTYQACNDQICLAPAEVEVIIPIKAVGLEQPVHRINRKLFSPLEVRWADAHYNLGKSYEAKGLLDKAIAEYEEATKLKPNNPCYLSGLAELFYRKGNYDKARATIKKVIALNPKDDSLKRQLKKFEEAKNR